MTRFQLNPSFALRHPLFWTALAVLVLNDHILKGSGILPGALTGKISDFAGLLVAPVLFALVTRVRSRRGLALAHFAVGTVFAAIQLSAPLAAAWSDLMAAFGTPWLITRDASDLIALPMLGLSYSVFSATMAARRASSRRAIEATGAGVGMLACVATSQVPEPGEFFSDFNANAFLHNESDQDVNVLLRPLSAAAEIDCFEAALDPGYFMRTALFDTGELWSMPARTNIPVEMDPSRQCTAVHVSGDLIAPFVMFNASPITQSVFVPGQSFDATELPNGGAVLIFGEDGEYRGHRSTGLQVDFDVSDRPLSEGEACAPMSEGDRVDWTALSTGDYSVLGAQLGIDGCHALSLLDSTEREHEWYLCVPEALQPFAIGDTVRITGASEVSQVLELERTNDQELVDIRLTVSRVPLNVGGVVATARASGCETQIDDACGVVAKPGEVSIRLGESTAVLAAGDTFSGITTDGVTSVDVHVAYAAARYTLLTDCSEGGNDTGMDVETVVLERSL